MVTAQKYIVMQATGGVNDGGPTYLKLIYMDTSPTFFLAGAVRGKGQSEIIGDKLISNNFVVKSHL